MITITHLTTNTDFDNLNQEWDQLLKQSPVDDAFLTWEWMHTWWKHFGYLYKLNLLIVRDDDQLVGIAPLMMETQRVLGFKIRVIRTIGIPSPDISGIIYKNNRSEVLKIVAGWLVEHHKLWNVLLIDGVPPEGMDFDIWSGEFPQKEYSSLLTNTTHYYISINKGWASYRSGLSKNLRNDIERKIRHINKEKGFRYCHRFGREITVQDMESIFLINNKSRHNYLYRGQVEQDFHKELAQLMAKLSWSDIYFLFFDDIPIAFYYGFFYNRTFEFWRSGFDNAYYKYSPGKILLYLLIQDGFEHGLQFIDFLDGDEEYKTQWQVNSKVFSNIRIVNKSTLPYLKYIIVPRVIRSLKNVINRNKKLHLLAVLHSRLVHFTQNTGIVKMHK